MRSIWKGAISFGLINIPIKVYTATEDQDLHFNYLHAECQTPLQYKRWCARCEREVDRPEMIRGYEYEKGKYVLIKEEDLAGIAVEKNRTIDIIDFVNLADIDPVYFARSYYLAPAQGGGKAYALLRQAMEKTSRIAVARVVLRAKESLAVIRVFEKALMLETIFYPEEIRSTDQITELKMEIKLQEKETQMAESLISSLSTRFDPHKYTNEYRQALRQMIEARIEGEEVVAPVRPAPGKVVDLMEALRESIRLAEAQRKVEADTAVKEDQSAESTKKKTPGRKSEKKEKGLSAK